MAGRSVDFQGLFWFIYLSFFFFFFFFVVFWFCLVSGFLISREWELVALFFVQDVWFSSQFVCCFTLPLGVIVRLWFVTVSHSVYLYCFAINVGIKHGFHALTFAKSRGRC